jgi:3'-phosphoadenosine 5'-phosphosulfate sulfotransferase (PAPS reductase)/FAD synthetase
MQSLPLEQKILKTQTKIMEWYQHWKGQVYVSFSGGKDSTVLFDIVQKTKNELFGDDVPAVFCDTGLEFPEIREFVKSFGLDVTTIRPKQGFQEIIENYGYPVISKDVSSKYEYYKKGSKWAIQKIDNPKDKIDKKYKKYTYLINAPFKISAKCCEILKKRPFKKYERETGRKCMTAMMASESILRRSSWIKYGCNIFDSKRPQSNPMSFWKEQDVLEYIKRYKIRYADSVYGEIIQNRNGKLTTSKFHRTGCIFCLFGINKDKEPNRIQQLKIQHPKLFNYCFENLGYKKVLEFLNIEFDKPKQQSFKFEQ